MSTLIAVLLNKISQGVSLVANMLLSSMIPQTFLRWWVISVMGLGSDTWNPFLWSSNQTFPWTAEPPWHHTTEVQTLTKAARALLPSSQRVRHHCWGPSRASQFCCLALNPSPQTGHGNSESVGNFCIYLKSLGIIIKNIQSSKLTKFFRCWNHQYNEEIKIGWHMCNGL